MDVELVVFRTSISHACTMYIYMRYTWVCVLSLTLYVFICFLYAGLFLCDFMPRLSVGYANTLANCGHIADRTHWNAIKDRNKYENMKRPVRYTHTHTQRSYLQRNYAMNNNIYCFLRTRTPHSRRHHIPSVDAIIIIIIVVVVVIPIDCALSLAIISACIFICINIFTANVWRCSSTI